ncbi:MAG: transposase of ISAzba6 family [Xanthobacteraceae bacterium]|nr:MAG: transposase of ISAzba6 family [Xanthobacteraceae bacterium]
MAQTVSIILFDEDRKALEVIAADRSRPLKHIQRAKIVLHSAGRLPVLEVARRAGVSRPAVWRSGGGNCAMPKRASTVCCATRHASRDARRSRKKSSPEFWS